MSEHIGIIGYGSFGSLLAGLLAPHVPVVVYDQRRVEDNLPAYVASETFAAVAGCPVIILAIDLAGIRSVCGQLKPLVKADTIVMDICSVKVKPAAIMQEVLGKHCRLLATHPLFGPNSVAANDGSARGFTLVWHELNGGPFPELEALFREGVGLTLQRMTPDEHDQQMAYVHALAFFVGRSLMTMNIPPLDLDTGYYQKLRALVELEKTHSRTLFDTVEAGNPYASAVRRTLMETMKQLDSEIQESIL